MVKNTNGGKKAKSMARKNQNDEVDGHFENERTLSNDLEKYGIVKKMLGNGFFYVDVEDIHGNGSGSIQLLGHIRNKFKAKNKRNNLLAVGMKVIVGLRQWEANSLHGFTNCDLLYICNQSFHDNQTIHNHHEQQDIHFLQHDHSFIHNSYQTLSIHESSSNILFNFNDI